MKRQHGYTLIEIMMVVAIIALLAMTGTALTGTWVQDANLVQVEGDLTQAIGRAKSSALRNEMTALGDAPVTAICISQSNFLTILEGSNGTSPSCSPASGSEIWHTQLDSDVTVKVGGTAISCMCFNNQGLLTDNACAGCSTSSELQLLTGNNHSETAYIY